MTFDPIGKSSEVKGQIFKMTVYPLTPPLNDLGCIFEALPGAQGILNYTPVNFQLNRSFL